MKITFKFFTLLFFLLQILVSSQEIVKTDTISGTILTISMDSKLQEDMAIIEARCEEKSVRDSALNKTTPKKPTSTVSSNPSRTFVGNRELTTAEICRKNPRISGYKIQVNVVKSNDEANKIKADFRRKFPYLKVITDASLRPNYKILAGSYFNKESASKDLRSIKSYFKSAVAVKYYIFCVEAK